MKRLANILGSLQVFVAIMALPAGVSMMVTPDGSGLGLPAETLINSPFADFLIPGLFLFVVNGIGNIFGAIFSFQKSEVLGILGLFLGFMLLIWIGIQVYFTGWIFFLQHLFFGIAILEIILSGWYIRKSTQDSNLSLS